MSSIIYNTSKVDQFYRITIPLQLIKYLNCKPETYIKLKLSKNNTSDYLYLIIPNKQPSRKYLQIRRKFLNHLKCNSYIKKKFNRLSNIYDNITITEFAKISQIKHRTSYMYLFRNEKLGFVSSYNVNKSTFYKLNDKGRKFLFLINKYNIIL
ncbi:hypothetical protein J4440_00430 [Candidatus Woesearchaeota archaeon]|nr:hypothetical protein [Candidatus Woesearchaeota archaeon]